MFFGNYSSGVGDAMFDAAAALLTNQTKLEQQIQQQGLQTQAQRDVAAGNTHYMHDNQINMDFPMLDFWVAPVARAIFSIPSNKEPIVASIRPILPTFRNPPPMPYGGGLGLTLKQYALANQTINDIMAYGQQGTGHTVKDVRDYANSLYTSAQSVAAKKPMVYTGMLKSLPTTTDGFPWIYAVGGLAVVGGAAYFLLFRK